MSKSKAYWELKKVDYPFRLEVIHMSKQDLDPAYFARLTKRHFLRVPFDGIAHWGFETHDQLKHFQKLAGVS